MADVGQYAKTRETGVYQRNGAMSVRVKHADGVWRFEQVGAVTLAEAAEFRRLRQREEDRRRAGLIDPAIERAEREATRPITEIIEEYVAQKRAEGHGAKHIKHHIERPLQAWARACGVRTLRDADPERLVKWLGDLAAKKHPGPDSARTRNMKRAAVLGLCRWAEVTRRLPRNPIPSALVKKANEDAGRVRLSRALSPAQFDALVRAAPPVRAAYYLLAGLTGLRWAEIRRLRWAEADFAERVLVVPASMTKNSRSADLPMPARVAEALLAVRPPRGSLQLDAPIFLATPTLRTWKEDLRRARIIGAPPKDNPGGAHRGDAGYEDERGMRLDRKCLRLSFNAWLEAAGVDLRDARDLMRHSDVNLTAKVYRRVQLAKAREASDHVAATLLQHERLSPRGDGGKVVQSAG